MFRATTLLLLGLGWSLFLTILPARAASVPARDFPRPVDSYQDEQIPSIFEKLARRIQREPLNLVAAIIFFAAITHTFLTAQFRKIAHHYQRRYEAIEELLPATAILPDGGKEHDKLIFRAQFFNFMGEVEAVFGIWLAPLFVAIIAFHGWSTMVDYVGQVNVADAIFVVVIMAMASSLPILRFTESLIAKVSAIGKGTPVSWWLTILTLGPLLGSFITGPAAMTICALLLRHRFYSLKPSHSLNYATLGLLFVNISVGGVLTQFASPPVVVVANVWNWNLLYMLTHFGWKAVIGIILANSFYVTLFRKEFARLASNVPDEELNQEGRRPIPSGITCIHILFLCWTVANAHYPVLVILGLLFFLAFVSATRLNQQAIALRPPLLVGFFLAALIIHGGCQQWWIAPVLGSLSKWPLMIGATILTAFNDNAAVTYLASLVPGFSDAFKYVVMAGAVTGGGLTVIANSPNPAGQSILASRFGEVGISALYLFLGALAPTVIDGAIFMLLP
ncbi:MAG TPA: putative Na+/H+ antiporter [Chthoniobacterales bacterium]|nr:putative Na+/H+ antiporter [Chthoniobacterales bacterium]